MDEIVAQLRQDDAGDGSRAARLQLREKEYREALEAQAVRQLAQEAVCRKDDGDTEPGLAILPRLDAAREQAVTQQLQALKDVVAPGELRFAVEDAVALDLGTSSHNRLAAMLRLPPDFPRACAVVELESSTLHEDLLARLQAASQREADRLAAAGGNALALLVVWLRGALQRGRLNTAYGDVQQLRALRGCAVGVREKAGVVCATLHEGAYSAQLELSLPDVYPQAPPQLRVVSSNLPQQLFAGFTAQAAAMALRLAQPAAAAVAVGMLQVGRDGAGTGPNSKAARKAGAQTLLSRKAEEALVDAAAQRQQEESEWRQKLAAEACQPSLAPIVEFLQQQCVVPLASGRCPVCEKRLLPTQPDKLAKVPAGMHVQQLLSCPHMYHSTCLGEYIRSPPFGKGCKVCGMRMSSRTHSTDTTLLEERWAHKQARMREVADVVDAFG